MTDQKSTIKDLYRHHGILSKIREQGIMDFSEKEQDRVFAGCVGPITCKRGLAMMIKDGLTMQEISTGA